MRMIRKILVFGMALTMLTAGLALGAEPIKMGTVVRLSIGAEHGIPSRRGVEMAVAEVNTHKANTQPSGRAPLPKLSHAEPISLRNSVNEPRAQRTQTSSDRMSNGSSAPAAASS